MKRHFSAPCLISKSRLVDVRQFVSRGLACGCFYQMAFFSFGLNLPWQISFGNNVSLEQLKKNDEKRQWFEVKHRHHNSLRQIFTCNFDKTLNMLCAFNRFRSISLLSKFKKLQAIKWIFLWIYRNSNDINFWMKNNIPLNINMNTNPNIRDIESNTLHTKWKGDCHFLLIRFSFYSFLSYRILSIKLLEKTDFRRLY